MVRIGKKAEADFTSLCMDENASVNSSDDDQHGWDHVVEIVPARKPNLPADLDTHVISCFVQIKATKGKGCTAVLKLSNAIKSAKSPLPSFVFLFVYDEQGAAPQIYACHIWKEQIHHWLKRARETEMSGRTDLHKLNVTIRFKNTDRLTINPATWIEQTLAPFGDSYAIRKHELVKTVGYGGSIGEGTINIGPDISVGDIVDHQIGLIESLPVLECKIFDTRFDIKSKQPIYDMAVGRLQITPSGRPLNLQLMSIDSEIYDISALGYAPATVGFEHSEFRIRIKAGHIDIVASPHDSKQMLDLGFDVYEEKSLEEQVGILKLFCWSQKGPVSFQALTDQGCLFGGTIKDIPDIEPWMRSLECSSSHLTELLGEQKCRDINITIRDLWRNIHSMYFCAVVYRANHFHFEGDFDTPAPPFEKLAGYIAFSIGDWSFGVIYEYTLDERTEHDDRTRFSFCNPKIVKKSVFKNDLEAVRAQTLSDYVDYKKQSGVPVAELGDGDLGAWSQQMSSSSEFHITVN